MESPQVHYEMRREITAVEEKAKTDLAIAVILAEARVKARQEQQRAIDNHLCGPSEYARLHRLLCEAGLIGAPDAKPRLGGALIPPDQK